MTLQFATETSPLSPKIASQSRNRCLPLSIVVLAYFVLVAILASTIHPFSSHNIHTSTIRQDVVENAVPQKLILAQPSPQFYLPALNRKMMLGSTRRSSDGKNGLRWGILGLGRIAHDFTSALLVSGCNVTAVASSSPSRSKDFAHRFSIPTYYSSYQDLANNPNVDIVYIATTNNNHMNPTLLMLQNGKNVLVEKPTTVKYEDTKLMYEEAKKRGLFLMTNHWTRFFPLIKYLRQNFLTNADMNDNDSNERRLKRREFHLGKVMAMKGDFSFATPLSPSDRFLNHTLGGGVTLDIGCYLIELALLAAYDHHMSTTSPINDSAKRTTAILHPDDISATGHGIMYNGLEFPVDVESSFSLRWGGGKYGVWNGECTENDEVACDTISVGGKGTKTLKHKEIDRIEDQFTMIASLQASFRRPSTFEVEYVFEHGRIVIAGPGNCPNEMTIYEYEPYGPLRREAKVSYPLPPIKDQLLKRFGTPNYPRAEGFAYVIDAIEECMADKGVPGKDEYLIDGGCLEMKENSIEEQLVTVEVTENVLKDMGYFTGAK